MRLFFFSLEQFSLGCVEFSVIISHFEYFLPFCIYPLALTYLCKFITWVDGSSVSISCLLKIYLLPLETRLLLLIVISDYTIFIRFFKELQVCFNCSCRYFIPIFPSRFFLLVIANGFNWAIAIGNFFFDIQNFSSYLLAIFMVNLMLYTTFYIIMKVSVLIQ